MRGSCFASGTVLQARRAFLRIDRPFKAGLPTAGSPNGLVTLEPLSLSSAGVPSWLISVGRPGPEGPGYRRPGRRMPGHLMSRSTSFPRSPNVLLFSVPTQLYFICCVASSSSSVVAGRRALIGIRSGVGSVRSVPETMWAKGWELEPLPRSALSSS